MCKSLHINIRYRFVKQFTVKFAAADETYNVDKFHGGKLRLYIKRYVCVFNTAEKCVIHTRAAHRCLKELT